MEGNEAGGSDQMVLLSKDRWWLGLDRKWWVMIAIGTGSMMTAIDSSVVNATVPLIMQSFGASLSSIQWVMMSYLLVLASTLLTFGRLGDMLGHKQVYNVGFVVFLLGSMLSGLAPSEWLLVASRCIEALGAAMVMANVSAIVANTFPPSQRGKAIGLQVTTSYVGLTLGPSVGGLVAGTFGWRWIFYMNIPVGIIAIVLALLAIPNVKHQRKGERFDPAGAAVVAAGLALLLLALSRGQEWGWASPIIIAMLAAASLLLAAFVWIENAVPQPMVDLTLFRYRLFSAATCSALSNYICAYGVSFLMPFYLVQARGYAPSFAGLLLTAMPVTMAIVSPLVGTFSDRVGSRLPATLGMAMMAVSLIALSTVGPETTTMGVIWRLALNGLSIGLFVSPNTSAILGAAPPRQRGVASGVVAMARNVGMVLGIAVSAALFSSGLARWTPVAPQMAFYEAIREAFIVIAGIAVLGVFISLVRGPQYAADHAPAKTG